MPNTALKARIDAWVRERLGVSDDAHLSGDDDADGVPDAVAGGGGGGGDAAAAATTDMSKCHL